MSADLSRQPTRRSSAGTAVVAVGLVIALVGTGLAWSTEHRHAADAEQQLAALRQGQAAQQSQLAAIAGKLTTAISQLGAQQAQLKADEKKLDLTTQALPPDLVALAARVTPSVIQIICSTGSGYSTGTGFALAVTPAPGYATTIVTAAHVVAGCETPDGGTLDALHGNDALGLVLRSYDAGSDVALLDTKTKLVPLSPGTDPLVGAFVMAVGNPLGLSTNVTAGSVSQVNEQDFLSSAPVSSGNSGGPIVDRKGHVIGIVDKVLTSTNGIAENLNVALRLAVLCQKLLSGQVCLTLR